MRPSNRRVQKRLATCGSLVGALFLLLLPPLSASAQPARPIDEVTNLVEDVYLFRHQSHQAIFMVTPNGVIVTDPISLEAATWLKAEISKRTD